MTCQLQLCFLFCTGNLETVKLLKQQNILEKNNISVTLVEFLMKAFYSSDTDSDILLAIFDLILDNF